MPINFPIFEAPSTPALVVIDSRVAGLATLPCGLREDLDTIVLPPEADGIAQLDRLLDARLARDLPPLDRLHLIVADESSASGASGCSDESGASGARRLGSGTVDAAALAGADWRAAFSDRAEVLVYGIEDDRVGDRDERTTLFSALRAATGAATIAARLPTRSTIPYLHPLAVEARSDVPLDAGDYAALQALHRATDGSHWTRCNWQVDRATPPPAATVADWWGVSVSGDRITEIALQNNNLRGELPRELGHLTALGELFLGGNQIHGAIPPAIGQLSRLTNLYLSGNDLSGPIPAALGDLKRLVWLSIGSNRLDGAIPPELARLVNLRCLYLNGNHLSGPIPHQLGALPHLQELYLSGNDLSGPIPASLGELRYLTHLSLGNNRLAGEIPAALSELSSLQTLYLHGNRLEGLVPPQLDRLLHLEAISLHGNPDLRLTFPSAIAASCLCPMFQPRAIEASFSRAANVSKNSDFASAKAGNFSSV